jgi:hypothetical protein
MPATMTDPRKKSPQKLARTVEAVLATKEYEVFHRLVRATTHLSWFSADDVSPDEVANMVQMIEPLIAYRAARCKSPDEPAAPDDVLAALESLQQAVEGVWKALRVFERVFGPATYLLPDPVRKDAV